MTDLTTPPAPGPQAGDAVPAPKGGAARAENSASGEPGGGVAALGRIALPGPDAPAEAFETAMRLALAEAALAGDDVPVGAIVLAPDGEVIGTGHNERELTGDPTAHAEVMALRAAAARLGEWRLAGCTLVVTLEPCTMCAGAAVLARLDMIVYGAVDLKAGAVGSLWDVVRDRRLNHRPEVIAGVLEAECGRLITEFFQHRRVG